MKGPAAGASVGVTLTTKTAATRSYAEARTSPCLSCSSSPCCTHLPLHTFQVRNLVELDHAQYLLNFDNIVLGISSSGDWSVYYDQACRFLDDECGCTLHDTPDQPSICVHYNPYSCWYRRVLTVDTHGDFVRIDAARMGWILDHVAFDADNVIVEVPEWDAMVATFSTMPLASAGRVAAAPDPVHEQWRAIALGRSAPPAAPPVPGAGAPDGPCSGCDASCCTTLVFPAAVPFTASGLDYLRFCLGFPGIELGIRAGSWSLVVKTRCRHLVDGGCSVFGREERPLLCRYYDAMKCSYRGEFGTPSPEGFLRVTLQELDALAGGLRYDGDGALVELPPFDELQRLVEEGVRAGAPA